MGKRIAEVDSWGSDEIREWEAFAILEPFGEERQALNIGYAFAQLANMWLPKGRPALQPADFMAEFEEKMEKRRQTAEEIRCSMFTYGRIINARAKRRGA